MLESQELVRTAPNEQSDDPIRSPAEGGGEGEGNEAPYFRNGSAAHLSASDAPLCLLPNLARFASRRGGLPLFLLYNPDEGPLFHSADRFARQLSRDTVRIDLEIALCHRAY